MSDYWTLGLWQLGLEPFLWRHLTAPGKQQNLHVKVNDNIKVHGVSSSFELFYCNSMSWLYCIRKEKKSLHFPVDAVHYCWHGSENLNRLKSKAFACWTWDCFSHFILAFIKHYSWTLIFCFPHPSISLSMPCVWGLTDTGNTLGTKVSDCQWLLSHQASDLCDLYATACVFLCGTHEWIVMVIGFLVNQPLQ